MLTLLSNTQTKDEKIFKMHLLKERPIQPDLILQDSKTTLHILLMKMKILRIILPKDQTSSQKFPKYKMCPS